jgi:NADPH2:quinone reductase
VKAVVLPRYGGPEVLSYEEVADPLPGAGEVLIKVEAASINFADVKLRVGEYHQGAPPPTIPGLDVAGTVARLGAGVSGLQVGQRVAAGLSGGGYAELAVASASLVWPLPDTVDSETGAAFPIAGITAYNVLTLAGRLVPGETVVVHSAAGGVGTTASRLARLLGAGLVIGTVGDRAKAQAALDAGCQEVIVRGEEDVAARVNELTAGAGADLILDSVAGETLTGGFAYLAPFGRLVAFGISSGEPGRALSDQLHPLNRAVVGYSSGHYRRYRPDALRPAAEAVLGLLADGRLRLVIGARFPLAEAARGHSLIESRASIGKILLLP